MSKEYKVGSHLELKIEKIVPNGFGLAFAEDLTVFVALAVAGDKLRVRIEQIKEKTAFAEIVEILEPSPDRIAPPCVYVGSCGGCDFQQMNYEAQLKAKVGIIRDCLTRIGKIDFPIDIQVTPSPKEFEYRSRAQWHLDIHNKKIGYFRRDSREVIDIEKCLILTPELEKTLEDFRENITWKNFWSEKAHIEAACGDDGQVSVYSSEVIQPTKEISFSADGETYFFSAQTFFQGNKFLIEKLLDLALKNATGETALDLYCGVGLFTLPMAKRFKQVLAVEENERAFDFAEKNAKNTRLENIQFFRENVREFLLKNEFGNIDFVLLDPPRAGVEKQTIQNVIKLSPKQVSYVSCEPAGLARDLRRFLDSGYSIESITALDMFPQTHHVETLVRLKLN